MRFIRYEEISPRQLISNPKNPRSDLGDLTELVESITQNGIYQELTVVPHGEVSVSEPDGRSKWKPGYMVIIGHRRLAAARKAGLEKVPCKVVEMSEREQQTTMLTENVQRSDLTPLEEAQGIQMCLDLGIPEAEIAKEAGMSRAKIRTRKVLLNYDPDMVKKSFASGATIQDYLALEKIKDKDKRESIIKKYAGTPDFNRFLDAAISDQKFQEFKEFVIDLVKDVAQPLPKGESQWSYDYITGYYSSEFNKGPEELKKEINEKVIAHAQKYPDRKMYYTTDHGCITFRMEPWQRARGKSPEQEEREEHGRRLDAALDVARYSRAKFVAEMKSFTPVNQHEARKKSFKFFVRSLFEYHNGLNLHKETINAIFGQAIWKDREKIIEFMANEFDNRPVYADILTEFLMRESRISTRSTFYADNSFNESGAKEIQELYDWLRRFNYHMGNGEKMLLDGTHPDYKKKAE